MSVFSLVLFFSTVCVLYFIACFLVWQFLRTRLGHSTVPKDIDESVGCVVLLKSITFLFDYLLENHFDLVETLFECLQFFLIE